VNLFISGVRVRNFQLLRFRNGLEKLDGIELADGFRPMYIPILKIEWINRSIYITTGLNSTVIIPGNFFRQKAFFRFKGEVNDED
jgi:hypothetical protein